MSTFSGFKWHAATTLKDNLHNSCGLHYIGQPMSPLWPLMPFNGSRVFFRVAEAVTPTEGVQTVWEIWAVDASFPSNRQDTDLRFKSNVWTRFHVAEWWSLLISQIGLMNRIVCVFCQAQSSCCRDVWHEDICKKFSLFSFVTSTRGSC